MLIDLYLQGRLDLDGFVSRDDRPRRRRGGVPQDGARRGAALRRGALTDAGSSWSRPTASSPSTAATGRSPTTSGSSATTGRCVVIDAAHDARADRRRGERPPGDGHRAHPRAQRPHQRRRAAARRRRRADPAARRRPDAVGRGVARRQPRPCTVAGGDASTVGGHELRRAAHARATPRAAAASTTPAATPCSAATRCSAAAPAPPAAATATNRPSCARSSTCCSPFPTHTVVHTGHGESTTIGAERDGVMARAAELGV